MERYEHRQRGPWLWLLGMPGAALVCAGLWFALQGTLADLVTFVSFELAGLVWLLGGACFAWLDVRGKADVLVVAFAPVHLFGTTIPYDAIESVERMRTNLLHGLGLYMVPWCFGVFWAWGFDAVRIRLKKRHGLMRVHTVIVSTDDPEGLAAFLAARIEALQPEP